MLDDWPGPCGTQPCLSASPSALLWPPKRPPGASTRVSFWRLTNRPFPSSSAAEWPREGGRKRRCSESCRAPLLTDPKYCGWAALLLPRGRCAGLSSCVSHGSVSKVYEPSRGKNKFENLYRKSYFSVIYRNLNTEWLHLSSFAQELSLPLKMCLKGGRKDVSPCAGEFQTGRGLCSDPRAWGWGMLLC